MNAKLSRLLPAVAIAAVVAVSASTGAVASALITGADIQNGTVTSADIKNKSVTGKDVKDGSLTGADLSARTLGDLAGATGPAGAAGAAGPAGAAGAPGVSGLQHVSTTVVVNPSDAAQLLVVCPDGKKILGMTADWSTNVEPTASRINPTLLSATAYGFNDTGAPQTLRASATCAFVG